MPEVILGQFFLLKTPTDSLPVLSVHSLVINLQLLNLNQWKRKNGHRNTCSFKSSRKNVVGINLCVACMPSHGVQRRMISVEFFFIFLDYYF